MGRKEEFEEWLKTQKKSNTEESYAEGSISVYLSAIDTVSEFGKTNNIFKQDLYSIDDSNELDRIYELLNLSQEYLDKNSTNKSRWSSALKLYKQFVVSTNLKLDNNKTDNKPQSDEDLSEKEISSEEDDVTPVRKKRYWLYSPGEQARLWNEFYDKKIMGIGWDELGDLTEYNSKEEMKSSMRELYNTDNSYINAGLALWQFVNDISVGDVIIVKKGLSLVLGRGVVESDYRYDENRSEYQHIHKVKWSCKGEWKHPGQAGIKTLTDITQYTEYVQELEQLFPKNAEIVVEDDEPASYDGYTKDDFLSDVYMTEANYETLKNLLHRKKNIILQGAPGVGKTYAATKLAHSIMGKKDTSRVQLIQFHQSYSYEDFVMGYRPGKEGFNLATGVFYNFCKKAQDDNERDYFFVIDEINRGNLSKIFGELFMLIEHDKRDEKNSIRLLYADEQFYIPSNVHIIGMMNTADRSLAMLDYALRRRFAFFEMEPAFDSDGFKSYQTDIGNEKFNVLITQIKLLNVQIEQDESLGAGFRIGHSYFIKAEEDTIDGMWLETVVNYEVIPLLKEYWFDEPSKVTDWTDRLKVAIR